MITTVRRLAETAEIVFYSCCAQPSEAEIMDFRCIFDRNELTTEFIKVMKETQKNQYHKAFSAKKVGEKTISDWEPWWVRSYPYFAWVNFYRAPE